MISEVYNMDCLDGMRKYPDNHFDLAIVETGKTGNNWRWKRL